MEETLEQRKTRLHKEVDSEYSPLIDKLKNSPFYFYAAMEVFHLWREEKIRVDKYAERFPTIKWFPVSVDPARVDVLDLGHWVLPPDCRTETE